jgi:prophage antirepressor-like protein
MGIELDVLVGHPEHDLLFVATQVAAAAGLKDAKGSVGGFRQTVAGKTMPFIKVGELGPMVEQLSTMRPTTMAANTFTRTLLAPEPTVYRLLLNGHAPQSEPFRRWVTEEVLPTIRKTGQYNAAESSDPIALGIMDELRLLRGELVELLEHFEDVPSDSPNEQKACKCPKTLHESTPRSVDRRSHS